MVLHNLCIDFADHPMDLCEVDSMQEGEDQNREDRLGYSGIEVNGSVQLPEGETEEALREQGRAKRETILNELFPSTEYMD